MARFMTIPSTKNLSRIARKLTWRNETFMPVVVSYCKPGVGDRDLHQHSTTSERRRLGCQLMDKESYGCDGDVLCAGKRIATPRARHEYRHVVVVVVVVISTAAYV
jgi:hypothetical protein